jgi:hypothetical protein
MTHGITRGVVTSRIKPDGSGYTVAGGTTNVNSDAIDMLGFEWCRITVGFGAISAGAATSTKLQDGDTSTPSTDVLGSSVTVADTNDNQIVVYEVYRPQKRYLRVATLRATQNAAIDFIVVERGGERKQPVTDDTTVIATRVMTSPAEGTA